MSFDSIPEDQEQSFQCPHCDIGNIKQLAGKWECDSCAFVSPENDGELDDK